MGASQKLGCPVACGPSRSISMLATRDEEAIAQREDHIGRDELNLAEFPITLLTDRPPPDLTRTVTYTDHIPDRSTGEMVTRKVTVTGSDQYGLTTATDADVLIALIQHTRLTNGFSAQRVPFSRYELLKILRWNMEGYSYKRVAQSLHRWTGITVRFDHSWRDKARRRWTSHTTHILNDVYFNSSIGRREKDAPDDQNCWYVWGEKIFESLQVGNLKRLDLDIYFGLNSAIAKFMYRYLDKHFYKRNDLRLDLQTFAHEKLGMSRKYKTALVKNKLQGPIQELVSVGFIEPEDNRYDRSEQGQWFIHFTRRNYPIVEETPAEQVYGVVAMRLMDYGVTKRVAMELAAKYPEETIGKQIQAMLWKRRQNPDAVKDMAAYLVAAIDQDWAVPDGYVEEIKKEERKVITETAEEETRRKALERRQQSEKIRAFWQALDDKQQKSFLDEAIDDLPEAEREEIVALSKGGPKNQAMYRLRQASARDRLIRKRLELPAEEAN